MDFGRQQFYFKDNKLVFKTSAVDASHLRKQFIDLTSTSFFSFTWEYVVSEQLITKAQPFHMSA